jgi:ribulose-phosphate 3-epimerase
VPREGRIKIAASILAADFSRLGEQVAEAADGGVDYIHVDVMDGHFVPSLTIGPPVVKAVRPWTKVPLDLHLMVSEPEQLVDALAAAGADIITVHAEACPHLHSIVRQIKDTGARAGVALNPGTPVSAVEEVLPELDLVLVMTVNPGLGGQPFIGSMADKISRMRRMLDEGALSTELEVDGGISSKTAAGVVQAGARVLVAGSAIYGSGTSVADAIIRIRDEAEGQPKERT